MPLDEEGAKWSCEPCIRGHRSSKCQHFDRLMMKVPKAGRPLAKCPHPKGSCSCQKLYAFMVRIPKGSTCLCRPLYKVPAEEAETGRSTPAPSAAPVTSPGPSKVQKNGRRQTTLQAAPENIAKALNSMPELENQQQMENGASNGSSYASRNATPNNSYTPLPTDFNQPATTVDQNPVSNNGNIMPQRSSCCSAKPQSPKPAQSQGSCCGKSKATVANGTEPELKLEENSQRVQMNGLPYQSMPSTPQALPWQDFGAMGQGPFMQPFSFQQPQAQPSHYFPGYTSNGHSTPSMNFQHQNSHNIDFTQASMQSLLSSNPQFTYAPPELGTEVHDCNCGDDCQCLGCATHPFNKTTRERVQEMGVLVSLDGEESGTNGYRNSPTSNQTNTNLLDYSFAGLSNPINGFHQNTMHTYSEPAPTPNLNNGYSSPGTYTPGQQLMHPSEYYTLEYPVGLPSSCTDITGSCQCGSDCSCIGCLTHSGHNGLTLDPPTTAAEDPVPNTTEPSGQPAPETGFSRIPVLDDLSVPSLSPQAIEP